MWYIGFYIWALVIPVVAFWLCRWWKPASRGLLPPGSMGLPLIGETLQFFVPSKSLDIPPFIKNRIQKYGPVFKTNLVGRPVIVSSDPDFNNFIFQQEGKSVQLWYMDSFSKLLGIGDAITGYVHKYLKKVVSEHFGPEKLKEKILSELEVIADQTLSSWTEHESVEMKRACSTMILNYTSKQLFGYDPEKGEENLSDLYFNLIKGVMSVPLNVPGTAFHKCLQKCTIIKSQIGGVHGGGRAQNPELRLTQVLRLGDQPW
ncbi:hypothetical protein SLEP1_g43345 [Rubroshorea leprosula]|uniref:Cytochrome P450 n=1 Tax=Rubroshorea leprosula TaxID=152421 RepID=A0AAV5LD84_9ROSI|nr:hypothetical protein SLEP1_g43345 [Rubroshorea leprosula]